MRPPSAGAHRRRDGHDRRPLGKSQERNLLDEPTLRHNQEAIKRQLAKLLDFESDAPNAAVLVNNYDWMKDISFLEFIRDIGKCITVNYMMAKDSVKKRFSGEGDGMSFTEFTYQLVQGFDFLHLYQTMNCKVQLGGADQWGNITTGTELIRRKLGSEAEAFAITCPLITKADGTKFGKTESGNVWLDARYTSPYKFYQFWLNVSDEDAKRYIRIFTLLDRETVEALTAEHEAAPHLRVLQKRLAQEITTMIHSKEEYEKAVEASAILFGGSTSEALRKLDEETLLQVFEGVPQFRIARAELGLPFVDLCAEENAGLPLEGRMPQDGAGRRRVAQQGEGRRRGARGDRSGPDRRQVPAGAEGQEELLPPDRRVDGVPHRSLADGVPRAARLLRAGTQGRQPLHGRSGTDGRAGPCAVQDDVRKTVNYLTVYEVVRCRCASRSTPSNGWR